MRKLTPERFLSIAWSLPPGNYVFESSAENVEFVREIIDTGKRKGIPCFTINFTQYNDAQQAFSSNEGESVIRAIEEKSKECIIYFESADVLATNDQ
jgi:hypothetical protein